MQVTLSSATLIYPASTIATVQILPGSAPTHAPTGTVQLVLENGLTSPMLTLSGSGHGSAAGQTAHGLTCKAHLKLVDIRFDDHALIDSLTDEEIKSLLREIYQGSPHDLMKHAEIGIKIRMGSDAVLPPYYS